MTHQSAKKEMAITMTTGRNIIIGALPILLSGRELTLALIQPARRKCVGAGL